MGIDGSSCECEAGYPLAQLPFQQGGIMKLSITRMILAVALVAGVGSAITARAAQAEQENPKLKKSWLVPGACPFCEWGATCECIPQ